MKEASRVSRRRVRQLPARVCDICGKTYTRPADLRYHISAVHSDAPPPTYPCTTCGRSFRKEKDLKVHIRMQRCFSKVGRIWPER